MLLVKFAESCGGKGYAIREPNEVKSIMHQAMKEREPTIIEAYVDPFEPPMPRPSTQCFKKYTYTFCGQQKKGL